MSKNKKYNFTIEQHGTNWKAQIIRQVTSKKTIVSKEKDGFESEAAANKWAESQLSEFSTIQGSSNKRHGEQRKLNEEERRQRSIRRAEKTAQTKENNIASEPISVDKETH